VIAAEPIGRRGSQQRGRLVLNLTVRTRDDDGGVAQPLLQLERVAVDLQMIADL